MATLPHIDSAEIAGLLPFATLIDRLEDAFRAPPQAPLRQRHDMSDGREMLIMPALGEDHSGAKLLTITPANATRGLPVIRGLFVLFDARDGAPLATFDADELTARRTAALAALAAKRLARQDATTLTLLGSGHLIPSIAEAILEVRPITRILLWGRDNVRAEAAALCVARRLPDAPVPEVVTTIETAIDAADILCAATRAQQPIIAGARLRAGVHVDLTGGYRPDMREIDDAGIASASIYVDTRAGALAEAGDLIDPIRRGVITASAVLGDLPALCRGEAGRRSADEITLYKSVGTAAADLLTARIAWAARRSA